jgi:hypothetical protein
MTNVKFLRVLASGPTSRPSSPSSTASESSGTATAGCATATPGKPATTTTPASMLTPWPTCSTTGCSVRHGEALPDLPDPERRVVLRRAHPEALAAPRSLSPTTRLLDGVGQAQSSRSQVTAVLLRLRGDRGPPARPHRAHLATARGRQGHPAEGHGRSRLRAVQPSPWSSPRPRRRPRDGTPRKEFRTGARRSLGYSSTTQSRRTVIHTPAANASTTSSNTRRTRSPFGVMRKVTSVAWEAA